MDTKHTPGPWEIESDPWHYDTLSFVVGGAKVDDKRCIQRQLGVSVGGFAAPPEQEANARLIAAAPELLEALQAAVECGLVPVSSAKDGGATRHSRQVHVADQIRAAISKAIGA